MFKNAKIGVKLPAIIVAISVFTALTLGIASTFIFGSFLTEAGYERLRMVGEVKSSRIQQLVNEVERDLRLRAEDKAIANAIIALSDSYASMGDEAETTLKRVFITENPNPAGQKDLLVNGNTNGSYGFIHATYHPFFDRVQNDMGYYDVFLFDTEGNVIYSVFKENDYATNVLTGPWKDTGLADAFREAIDNTISDPAVHIDFTPYEPSAFAPAAFMSRPVFNEQGALLGVIAYQMPIDKFNKAASTVENIGETADGFIVGADFLLRTDSVQTDGDDILQTSVDGDHIAKALNGESTNFETVGLTGNQVIGFASSIEFGDDRWVFVLQKDRAELLSKLPTALMWIGSVSIATIAFAILASLTVSRGIAAPMKNLTDAVVLVSNGALNTEVPETQRQDEIGELARAAEDFRQNAIRMEQLNEEQVKATKELEELNTEKEKAAKREAEFAKEKEAREEETKKERRAMMQNLGNSIGAVVNEAKAGNFTSRVDAKFDDPTLAQLSQGINELMDTVDVGLVEIGKTLERIAAGDLTHSMQGNFQGAFLDLQNNTNSMISSLKKLIGDISGAADNLSHSSRELHDTSNGLSKQSEQNAASLEETSAALEELSASIRQVNHNISSASEDARAARDTATAGGVVAAEAGEAMNRIDAASNEISQVVSVINDISFQINLLALNAGVEAARAGEAGRGFSVVASEVRQLAQRASDAASEIAEVISRSDSAVSDGVAKVKDAETSLQSISESVVDVSGKIQEVAQAISEQVSGISEINASVALIDQNTQKQVASFEEVTAASMVLAEEVKGLQHSSQSFNTGPTDAGTRRRSTQTPTPTNSSQDLTPARLTHASNGNLALSNDGWEEF